MARPRASDYENKQRNILDAAAAVFAGAGMEKASMAEIARQGGTSKAVLYHYYASKDALIFDIVRTHLSALDEALTDADDTSLPAEDRLRKLILVVMDQYQDAGDKHQVQLNCANNLPAEQTETLRQMERLVVHRFSSVLALINPNLEGDRSLLMPVTMTLFGMLNWIELWFREDGPVSREDCANMITSLMLGGVKTLR